MTVAAPGTPLPAAPSVRLGDLLEYTWLADTAVADIPDFGMDEGELAAWFERAMDQPFTAAERAALPAMTMRQATDTLIHDREARLEALIARTNMATLRRRMLNAIGGDPRVVGG